MFFIYTNKNHHLNDNIHIQNEISVFLSHTSEQNQAFDKLIEIICKIDGVDSGGLYLVDPDDDSLHLVAHFGFSEDFIDNVSHFLADSHNAKVVNRGESLYTNNISDGKFLNEYIRSTAVIPIHHNNKSIACLNLASHLYDTIPIKTRELLESIALNLGGAIARIRSEQALKDMQTELKIANDTKDKFFSIIAHDLRGPIGNLMQISEMIFDNVKENGKIPKNLISSQKNISKNTFFLLENLLNWARCNNHQIDFDPIKININEIIDYNIENVKYQAETKKVSIIKNYTENFECYGDENMIDLIIRNILSNAIKFNSIKGRVDIDMYCKDSMIYIKISDKGIGISKENIEKIISNNTSFTTYGTSNEKGSGLGLELCKYFIKINGGTFEIESKLKKGSSFTFSLKKFIDF